MLKSMTGFASKTVSIPLESNEQAAITISIKSLNSRFFEATFKLPYTMSHLETDLMQLCKTNLKRGHIFFNIYMSNPNLLKAAVEPSMNIVQNYLNALNKVKEKFNISGTLTISDLLQLPNIFSVEEKAIDEKIKTLIFNSTQEVIAQLNEERKKEGAAIEKDMKTRCEILTKEIQEIEQAAEKLMLKRKTEITNTLKELASQASEIIETQQSTYFNELNKIDIHEEIIRFKSHLANIQSLLNLPDEEKGKRIDFTLQELAREINTIAAKGSDATISALAINIKIELEKIREQAQNLV